MVKKSRRWTQEEVAGLSQGFVAGKGRYGNVKKPTHDGIRFDSKREMLRYMDLKLLEKAGEISELKAHPRYPLFGMNGKLLMKSERYPNGRQMVYIADFSYLEHSMAGLDPVQRIVVEDVKMQSGHRTEVYKIKRSIMACMGITIREY